MKQKIIIFIFLLTGSGLIANAQQTVAGAGGDAFGNGGSAAYTVGQITYTTHAAPTGSMVQGVQIANEVYTVNIQEAENMSAILLYPNPATDALMLKLNAPLQREMFFRLYDPQGKLLQQTPITSDQMLIDVAGLPGGAYFIAVFSADSKVQTLIIIKQ
ncbi:MAG TPA: T9SS type A sorting domain-containing protein [Saprospiraceae bacterium]|nr:T9SS type A sorting domain-containing protein [Saprospiraceae bacterium]